MNSTNREEQILQAASSYPLGENGADLTHFPQPLSERLKELCAGAGYPGDGTWNAYVCSWLLTDYYPDSQETASFRAERKAAVLFYLDVLNALFDREERLLGRGKTRSLVFLDTDEAKGYECSAAYLRLLRCLKEEYLYAFMRLHRVVTGFDTLGHISGVSYLTACIAKQLLQTEVRVDPALACGAAILHDIGKYGCRPEETDRVAYLHYYYTYEYARRKNLGQLGIIASAHSVWDLELENLSVESLLLIYADFRVKSMRGKDGSEKVCFWSLDQSYDIILGKLDNVDENKRRRYAKVYAKLKDFEDYLVFLGVSVEPENTAREPDVSAGPESATCEPGISAGPESTTCEPGISAGPESATRKPHKSTPYSLMSADEMIRAYKFLAISHNLKVMDTTGHDASFISLLEDIRAERDWRHVRAFLTVIEEYSAYFSQEQKLVILDFLYEMLSHQDGDIRRQSARICAKVMAGFDIVFKKELPEDVSAPRIGRRMVDVWSSFLHRMLFPGHMITEQHRRWIGYGMKTVIQCLLSMTEGVRRREVLHVILEHYKSSRWEGLTRFLLLDCLPEIPCSMCSANQQKLLFRFVRRFLNSGETEIRVSALRAIVCWLRQGLKCDEEMKTALSSLCLQAEDPVCVRYLFSTIRALAFGENISIEYDPVVLYIENQRSEISWINKLVNLEILQKEMLEEMDLLKVYQYACHLLNLLQFSSRVTNQLQAGESLVQIMPRLSEPQRYEIVLELIRALGMGKYSAAKYIPPFLGRIYVFMTAQERKPLLAQFRTLCGSPSAAVVILTLETVSIILQHLPGGETKGGIESGIGSGIEGGIGNGIEGGIGIGSGIEGGIRIKGDIGSGIEGGIRSGIEGGIRSGIEGGIRSGIEGGIGREGRIDEAERHALEGLLVSGTVHYDPEVSREAFYFLGAGLFGSSVPGLEQKKDFFTAMARRVLTYILWEQENMLWYYNAASLNYIYRFLTDYLQERGRIQFEKRSKIAFFPGTFDPFSLGHKAIVREIASMGFHVFLAVDEFSWSKSTQPYKIRRKIMAMSVADLNHVFLFPVEIPVNIACPKDLERLRACFPDEEVYIVAGSDVVEHASAYRAAPAKHSIHTFPHIIFARNTEGSGTRNLPSEEAFSRLQNEVLWLRLPAYYETMSSTRIRRNVSANKDIGDLVESVVQNYIYELGLYTMDPIYKRAARVRMIDTCRSDHLEPDLARELALRFPASMLPAHETPAHAVPDEGFPSRSSPAGTFPAHKLSDDMVSAQGAPVLPPGQTRCVVLRNESDQDKICGAVLYHDLAVRELLDECKDIDLAADLRGRISGRSCVISQILGEADGMHDERFTALAEMLAICQEEGYSYALHFHGSQDKDLLESFGFLPIPDMPECWMVDMRHPLVLFFDTPSFIKDPFLEDPMIRKVLWRCNRRLRHVIAGLFPGQLVLCLDSEVMNHRLIRLIIDSNPIPPVQYTAKTLGEKICVPFGKILKGVLVPNCVTKDLNTEKLYDIDMERFEIREFPQYAPLDVQIRTIKSFMRPVILVDDLFHKGYRLNAVKDVMKKEGTILDRLIVGVRSGRGNDLALQSGEPVRSVYFVPHMRSWLIESDLYPFIGGDGIRVKEQIHSSPSLPSVNSILPYQFPSFMKGASMAAFYNMSGICLENARDILLALEKRYQKKYCRKLTMARIGEVLAEPRHPDTCILDTSVVQESPSILLEREIQKLRRLKHLLDGEFVLEGEHHA